MLQQKNLVASIFAISGSIRKHIISHSPVPPSLPLKGSFLIIFTAKVKSEQRPKGAEVAQFYSESVRWKVAPRSSPLTVSQVSRATREK